jgi:hypothetical protein
VDVVICVEMFMYVQTLFRFRFCVYFIFHR